MKKPSQVPRGPNLLAAIKAHRSIRYSTATVVRVLDFTNYQAAAAAGAKGRGRMVAAAAAGGRWKCPYCSQPEGDFTQQYISDHITRHIVEMEAERRIWAARSKKQAKAKSKAASKAAKKANRLARKSGY